MNVWIKVCGVTTVADAHAAIEAGVDAIGLNFVPSSKRFLSPEVAAELVRSVGPEAVSWVGVVADETPARLRALSEQLRLDWWQLHGGETPTDLERVLPCAYKAVSIAGPDDVARARSFGGDRLLVDAHAPGLLGGSGRTFDWALVRDLARERPIVLAGGLRADNVAEAIREVHPWGVDVASGVESAPGRKDVAAMRRFVAEARAAAARVTPVQPITGGPPPTHLPRDEDERS